MQTWRYYLPGIILILIALLIMAIPEILIAFVATLIIMAGIGALYVGHNMRKSAEEFRDMNAGFDEDDFFRQRFVRRPVFRWFDKNYW